MSEQSSAAMHSVPNRRECRDAFLAQHTPGGAADVKDIPADASFRSYARVTAADGRTFMVMDAPGAETDRVPDFINVAEALRQAQLRAPEIIARDLSQGFLLLEDFGDDSVSRLLSTASVQEETAVYEDAVRVLLPLRNAAQTANLPPYDTEALRGEVDLLTEWYLPFMDNADGKADMTALAAAYRAFWDDAFSTLTVRQTDVVLRDFHADNIHILPGVTGAERCGLLDFQDALAGDSMYDVVSLLTDIRRTVSDDAVAAAKAVYINGLSGQEKEEADMRYALFAAQRNCKILGIFVRLARRDGKQRYLSYLPQTREAVRRACEHPATEALGRILAPIL